MLQSDIDVQICAIEITEYLYEQENDNKTLFRPASLKEVMTSQHDYDDKTIYKALDMAVENGYIKKYYTKNEYSYACSEKGIAFVQKIQQ